MNKFLTLLMVALLGISSIATAQDITKDDAFKQLIKHTTGRQIHRQKEYEQCEKYCGSNKPSRQHLFLYFRFFHRLFIFGFLGCCSLFLL